MVAVLDQGEHDVVLGKPRHQLDRMVPRHVRVLHALQDADRAAGLDHAAEEEMVASLLDERPRDQVRLVRVVRRPRPHARLLKLAPHLGRKALPHQHLGEIDRRRDQHQARHGGGRLARCHAAPELPRQQQRDPAAHGRTDHDLRTPAERFEHRDALFKPAADGAVREGAAGLAVTGIIEPDAFAAVLRRPPRQGFRLGSLHVGLETAEPKHAGRCAVRPPHGDPSRLGRTTYPQEITRRIVHSWFTKDRRHEASGDRNSLRHRPRDWPLHRFHR